MNKSAALDHLFSSAAWTAGLGAAERRCVRDELYERHYGAGDVVWRAGDPAAAWMGIVAGMVKVASSDAEGRGTIFMAMSTGGWLGEGSVIKGEPLRYEVVALQKSHIGFMPRATFLRLLASSLPFNHFIIGQLNARLGQFLALTESRRVRDPVAQVAHCVAELFNPLLNPAPLRDIRISQLEVGLLCGLSRRVANHALHRLEREGLLQLHHHGLEVLDVSGLQRFVTLH